MSLWHKEPDLSELPDAAFYDFETAWKAWTMGEAFGWLVLPFSGGYLEQPEALMIDMNMIAAISRRVKESKRGRSKHS